MRLGNVQNTAGMNHSRCCTIAEIRCCLPEISKFKKKSEMAKLSQLPTPHSHPGSANVPRVVDRATWTLKAKVDKRHDNDETSLMGSLHV